MAESVKMWAIKTGTGFIDWVERSEGEAWQSYYRSTMTNLSQSELKLMGYRAIRVTVTPDEPEKPKRKKKDPPSSSGRSGHSTGNGPGGGLDYATSY